MDFWPEFLASSWGREFVAGGFGGIAGITAGYPLDTLRVRQQQSGSKGSATTILRHVASKEGPLALYRGMAAPLASVTFQACLCCAFAYFSCLRFMLLFHKFAEMFSVPFVRLWSQNLFGNQPWFLALNIQFICLMLSFSKIIRTPSFF